MIKYALVGNVGGTNAHPALRDITSGETSQAKIYSGLDHPSLEAVIRVYLEEYKVEMKDDCTAIVYPIIGDWVATTNHTWVLSIAEVKENLGFSHLETTNDFIVVSMAVLIPKKGHLIRSGDAEPAEGKPIAVYGAGIRPGVAHLVHVDKCQVNLPGEGSHTDLVPNSEEEGIILEISRVKIGHVSAERVLSDSRLVNLHRVIIKADNRLPENLKLKDIIERVPAGSHANCRRALSLFCVITDHLGDNLALNLGTFGGVLIAGGVASRFPEFFKASGLRIAFEDKGCFKEYVRDIPVHLTIHDNPGLLGSDAHLRQTLGHIL